MIPTTDSFLAEWSEPFKLAHEGLNYLSSFPRQQLKGFHPGPALTFEERLEWLDEWLLQYTAKDSLDQEFFKPYWIPVRKDSIDPLYLNLALPGLPVICALYVQTCPPIWGGTLLWRTFGELLLYVEKGSTAEDIVCRRIFLEMMAMRKWKDSDKGTMLNLGGQLQ